MNSRHAILIFCCLICIPAVLRCEEAWTAGLEGSLYVFSDTAYFNPVLVADRSAFHLEARYNYEDMDTASFFAGYSIEAGESLHCSFIPMIGAAVGNTDGIAPAFQFEVTYGKLGFYSEGEYMFSFEEKESNFFYAFSELTYAPADWFWFGLAGQRTRAYETELEIQRGFLVGAQAGPVAVTAYVMNAGWGDPFALLAFSFEW